MVILIVLTSGLFYLINIFSGENNKSDAWKLLIINTIYAFLVWICSERILDRIGKRYPSVEDTPKRILLKLGAFLGLNAVLVALSTFVCYLLDIWKGSNNWLGYYFWTFGMVCFFGGIILAIYEGLYLYRK